MTRVRRMSESEKRLMATIASMTTEREIGEASRTIVKAIAGRNNAAVLYALVGHLVATALRLNDGDYPRSLEFTEAMLLHFRAARVKE